MSSMTFREDFEVDKLLNHPNNFAIKNVVIGSGNHGNHDRSDKRSGDQIRGSEEKADIGVLANLIGTRATSKLTGIGETQVSNFKNGKNSNNESDVEVIESMEKRLSFLETKAIDKVDLFLKMISNDNVSNLSADKMASSAEKMTNVLDKLRRRNEESNKRANAPIIHIHGPAMVKSDTYVEKEV